MSIHVINIESLYDVKIVKDSNENFIYTYGNLESKIIMIEVSGLRVSSLIKVLKTLDYQHFLDENGYDISNSYFNNQLFCVLLNRNNDKVKVFRKSELLFRINKLDDYSVINNILSITEKQFIDYNAQI